MDARPASNAGAMEKSLGNPSRKGGLQGWAIIRDRARLDTRKRIRAVVLGNERQQPRSGQVSTLSDICRSLAHPPSCQILV